MDAQPGSSLLLPDEEQRQLRVVYAADDQQRSERVDGGETRRAGPSSSNAGAAGDLARRGRRRKFVTRHHLESGAAEPAREGAHVREEIDRALQTFRGMDTRMPSTSHAGSVEVQGRERFLDSLGVAGVRGTPVTGPSGEMPPASQGPVTVGAGPHALVLDAGMIEMINKSASGRRSGNTGAKTGRGRGGRDRGGGKRQPVRRREGLAALGGAQQSKLRRTLHTPLSGKILAQEDTPVESGTPNKSLDAFVSQLQAPSPDQAPVRVRMRAPTSLAEQANTLGPRLHFDASNARGVSTLRVRVIRAERENGKFKCLCHCEHPMGVFEGHLVLMVTNQIVGLEEVREGAGLILNKPWLVLGGLEVEETKIPALFPLHPVTWAGAECA
jgi:hypothetical protein